MTRQPVMLMDTRTFAYSVYDPVNGKIGSINQVGIDENNFYHRWQMIEMDGNSFLYNIGAKKSPSDKLKSKARVSSCFSKS